MTLTLTLTLTRCGVKGEGAFAALFAPQAAEGRRGRAGPVVVFDEIEEARQDFMTSALVNAIDKRGFVELTRKPADGPCVTEHARLGLASRLT